MTQSEIQFKQITGESFNEFYYSHKPKLIWYLHGLTNNMDVAQDFADEAFMQGLHKIDQFNPDKAKIHTWIYHIGKNLVIEDWKRQQKLPSLSIDQKIDEDTTIGSFLAADNHQHEDEEYEKVVRQKALLTKEAIQNLPDKYREVMILRELENKQYKDIAVQLKRNLSTVKSQIKKGRELVTKRVDKKFKSLTEHGIKDTKK